MSTNLFTDQIELLTFQLDTEIVAVEAIRVQEILDHTSVTDVPGAQPFVNGLINVRGQVIPLADLRLKLDLKVLPPTTDSRIIVLESDVDGERVIVGVRADKVFEVTELTAEAVEEAPRIGMRWRPEHVRFIGKRGADLIIALDVDKILSAEPPARSGPTASTQPNEHATASAELAVP